MSRHHSENCKVYVGDLPKDASEKELERVFREFGSLRSVWVARNPPGFAFVEFDDERDAEDAVKSLDGSKICGVQARVKHSTDKPPRQRPPTRRPYDPNDRCYKCNKRGHYAYDCDKYAGGVGTGHIRGQDQGRMRGEGRATAEVVAQAGVAGDEGAHHVLDRGRESKRYSKNIRLV